MLLVDVKADQIVDAYNKLKAKEGVCDHPPNVRLTMHDFGFRTELICTHPNPSLNCGAGALHCDWCLGKESQKKANIQFAKELQKMASMPALMGVEKDRQEK